MGLGGGTDGSRVFVGNADACGNGSGGGEVGGATDRGDCRGGEDSSRKDKDRATTPRWSSSTNASIEFYEVILQHEISSHELVSPLTRA
eukprot:scaffold42455_cov79-Cyclotella_meneghiniana.AAC.4